MNRVFSDSGSDSDESIEEEEVEFTEGMLLMQFLEEEEEAAEEEEEEEERIEAAMRVLLEAIHEGREVRRAARRATRNFLRRADLQPDPRRRTGWKYLYENRSDSAYITAMGIDVATFDLLLDSGFREYWFGRTLARNDVNREGFPRHQRRLLDSAGGLGLVLHFLTSSCQEHRLQVTFAITPSCCTRYLKFGLAGLDDVLSKMSQAQIRWPSESRMQEYSAMIKARHGSILQGGFGFVDGLNLPVQKSDDEEMENATYNGWLHDHMISSVIGFAPSGEIIYLVTNCPGSWHDARIASSLYDKLRERTPDGFFLLADTAFPRSDSLSDRIRSPLKTGTRLPSDPHERDAVLQMSREVTTARQAAEWGMRSIQGSFSRLRTPLPISDKILRARILMCCFRLHQLRVRCVGINQIKTVYDPLWEGSQEQALEHMSSAALGIDRRRNHISRFQVVGGESGYTVRHG